MASIFGEGDVPKGTGKGKDVEELKEIWRKQHPLMHTDEILSPERSKEQLAKEKKAATTAANKELFKGGKKKRKTRKKTRKKRKKKKRKTKKRRKRKKRKTKKMYRNQRGCKR